MTVEELDAMSAEDLQAYCEYMQKCEQTGVASTYEATLLDRGWHKELTSEMKHLRVGVDYSLVDNAAIVKLLKDKGIITEKEYWRAVAWALNHEIELLKNIFKKKHPEVKTIDFAPAGMGAEPSD